MVKSMLIYKSSHFSGEYMDVLIKVDNGCVDKGVGFLMFISGFTIAMIPYLDSYYLFGSHSRNGQGSMIPKSKSILLKFSGLQDIEKYVQGVYLQ